jgi:hypothetical protein
LQDVEKGLMRRSRLAQRLNVRQKVRFASSLAAALLKAFLNILRDYLALSVTSREFESPRIFFNS